MDNGKSSAPPKQKKDNITRFRRDMRLTVVQVVRTLALFLILGSVVFGVFKYREELDINNIRRLVSYARASSAGNSGEFSRYSFEPGLSTVYRPFELGLAVVSSDTYHFVSGYSDTGFSAQIKYGNPVICTSQRQVLIYDQGNYGYCVANAYSVIHSGTSASPITAGSMNSRGDYALVKNEAGYRAGVYVYDYKNREKCVWQTPKYWVLDVSLSPECDYFAALCMTDGADGAVTQVRVYAIGQEEPAFVIDLGGKRVYSVKHYKNGNLFILCEDGLFIYDTQGRPAGSYSVSGITMFAHQQEELPMVAISVRGVQEKTRLLIFGQEGLPLLDTLVDGSLRDMDFCGGTGLALFADKLVVADVTGEESVTETRDTGGARSVMCTQTGDGILVFSDRAEKLPPQAGE